MMKRKMELNNLELEAKLKEKKLESLEIKMAADREMIEAERETAKTQRLAQEALKEIIKCQRQKGSQSAHLRSTMVDIGNVQL